MGVELTEAVEMLEVRIQRKRNAVVADEIYLSVPNKRQRILLERVSSDGSDESSVDVKKMAAADVELEILSAASKQEGYTIEAVVKESTVDKENNIDGSIITDTYKAKIVPSWIRSLKKRQLLETTKATTLTDLDFDQRAYDVEHDSNEECDYPEKGCYDVADFTR